MATLAVEDHGVDPPIGDESVESGIAPNSLLPLNEYEARLDLTGYFLEELKAVPASEVLENLEYIGDTYTIQPDAEIAWATGRYNDIDDDYTIITDWETDTIDLSPEYYYDTEVTLELVVGTADQLNPQNVRTIVDVAITAPRDLLDFTIYTNDAPRTEVEVFSTYFSERNSVYQIGVDSEDWKSGQAVYLSMKLSSEFDSEDLTAAV